jgi:hypothetical protein
MRSYGFLRYSPPYWTVSIDAIVMSSRRGDCLVYPRIVSTDVTDFIFRTPAAPSTGIGANDLNADGTIVGGYDHHAYLRLSDGTFHQIHVPESTYTTARSINNHGAITGITCTQVICQCFVRTPEGALSLFSVPGARETSCMVISDAGELGGSYRDANDVRHGFVTKPQR